MLPQVQRFKVSDGIAGVVGALSFVIVAQKTLYGLVNVIAGVVGALSFVIVALKTIYGLVNLWMQYSLEGHPRLLPTEVQISKQAN